MNQALIERIHTLTHSDTKSLLETVLKLSEEVGTLSQKMLAYQRCAGNTHRFVQRHNLLDDVADSILVAMSVAVKLGYTHEELVAQMSTKTDKWASLQAREASVRYPLPYELHLTVAEANSEQFKVDCLVLGVKPIVLALQLHSGKSDLRDVMTSSVHMGDNGSVVEELARISAGLKKAGYSVIREKIETVPWHPMAPALKNGVSAMPAGCYFESHFNVVVEGQDGKPALETHQRLQALAKEHGAHLSRNAFKMLAADVYTVMLTLRTYEGVLEDFEAQCCRLKEALLAAEFPVEKTIVEFSMYDTRVHHDSAWLARA